MAVYISDEQFANTELPFLAADLGIPDEPNLSVILQAAIARIATDLGIDPEDPEKATWQNMAAKMNGNKEFDLKRRSYGKALNAYIFASLVFAQLKEKRT